MIHELTEGGQEEPWLVSWSFWKDQEEFRVALRESLSGITVGLLAIAALPMVASRASRDDNVHAHVDSHVGWQLARLASALLAVLSWLSLPLTAEERHGPGDWVGVPGIALAVVILLATGPRYLHILAGEKSLEGRVYRLEKSMESATEELERARAWRRYVRLIYYVGLGVWVLVWLVVAWIDGDAHWYVALLIAGVGLALGRGLELTIRIRLAFEPVDSPSWVLAFAKFLQLLASLYIILLMLFVLISGSGSIMGSWVSVWIGAWVAIGAIVYAIKPPIQILSLRISCLAKKLNRARANLGRIRLLREAE